MSRARSRNGKRNLSRQFPDLLSHQPCCTWSTYAAQVQLRDSRLWGAFSADVNGNLLIDAFPTALHTMQKSKSGPKPNAEVKATFHRQAGRKTICATLLRVLYPNSNHSEIFPHYIQCASLLNPEPSSQVTELPLAPHQDGGSCQRIC